ENMCATRRQRARSCPGHRSRTAITQRLFFFQAEDGIRDLIVTGVQTCALPICCGSIGTRHLHNLKKIGVRDIAICDEDKKKVDDLAKKYDTKKFYDLNSALTFEPDFSIVSTYPSSRSEERRVGKECRFKI